MQHNRQKVQYRPTEATNTVNPVVNLDNWCNAANDDSIHFFLKTTLQTMIRDHLRELHIEQELEFCRVRARVNGRLTEQKYYNPTFATELLECIQQEHRNTEPSLLAPDDSEYSEFGTLNIRVLVDGENCELKIYHYHTISGKCLTLSLIAASAIPEVLEQTHLDSRAKQEIRRHYSSMHTNGITLICSNSDSLLRSIYYALLGEVNSVDRKIVSLQHSIDKQVPRVSQILVKRRPHSTADPCDFDSLVSAVTQLSDHTFVDWEGTRSNRVVQSLRSTDQTTLFWKGDITPGLLQLFSRERCRLNLHTIIELQDTALICPHCAEVYKPSKTDFKWLPKSKSNLELESFFYASGCNRCDETGVSALTTVASICKGTNAIKDAVANQSIQATERAVLSAQGNTSVRLQIEMLAKTGQICFEGWIKQQY